MRSSLELWGSKRSDLSFRSSMCKVFQKYVLFSLLSQPILIADQKVDTLCRPSPLFDLWANSTFWETILAFSFTMSSVSEGSFSPLIKSIIIFTQLFLTCFRGEVNKLISVARKSLMVEKSDFFSSL